MSRAVNSTSSISIHAAAIAEGMVLCAALPFEPATGEAPEFIHLLPAGDVSTIDGRGPYRVPDLNALIARSLPEGERLVLDENHSTDLAAPEGRPSPAMGWIVSLQAREDGLWGKVDWTDAGKALVAGKAYRGVSPALQMVKSGNDQVVQRVLRASLVNRPNIKNLTTLHQETNVNPLLAKLIAALGLKTDTSEDTLVTAVTALHQAQKDNGVVLNSIATEAGIKAGETINGEVVLNAVKKLKAAPAGDATITALQTELNGVAGELKTLRDSTSRDKAVAFVDGAIQKRTVGVSARREEFITMHMTDPKATEHLVAGFGTLGPSGAQVVPPKKDGDVSLNEAELEVSRQLGIPPKAFAKTRDGDSAAA